VKRLIHRVLAWELDPISDQVNGLQRATADALDRADDRTQPERHGSSTDGSGADA
jgi:hypothetical protein